MRISSMILTVPFTLAVLTSSAQAAPADIQVIASAADQIEEDLALKGKDAEKRFIGLFTRMVLDQALAVGSQQGITEVAGLDTKEFKAFVLKGVAPKVESTSRISDDQKRRDGWYDLLRQCSSEGTGHRVLAAWMDFEPPASYLSKATRGDPPRISSQVSSTSSDGRLKIYEPNITLGGELGGAGQGNAVLDAGEWINLGLALYNDSSRPFFSSSAWVVSGHECAWVPKAFEIEVQELPARVQEELEEGQAETPPQTEALSSWVYLSKTCKDRSVVPLQVKVLDTHRAPTTPVVLAVQLTVRNRGQATVHNYLVDSDVPGWSDGEALPEIDIEREFEMSHGIATSTSGLLSARAAWAIRKDLVPIFKEQKTAAEPLLYDSDGRFLAGDDLDLMTHELKEYDLAVQAVADELEWDSLDQSRAWFATDTEILFATPDPAIEAPPPPPPPEVCDNYLDDDGDGKHDCQDSECEEAKVCNIPKPVDFKSLFNIIAANAEIEPEPAKPTLPGAIDAVDHGYELVVDKDNLALQYQCLIERIPLAECGKVVCPECEVVEEEKKEVVVDTGRDPAVAYTYRNYFTLPMHWNPHESPVYGNCEDERDNDLNLLADCADSECPCTESECDDGIDNDFDGLVDRDDPDCPDPVEQVCDDDEDNDGDGAVDCDDSDCPTKKKEKGADCSDGFDNDCDGAADDADSDCAPSYSRLDLGVSIGTIAMTDAPAAGLEWTLDAGAASAVNFRYAYGKNASKPMRALISVEKTPSYSIVNGGSDTYSSWVLGLGIAPHWDFADGRVGVELQLLATVVDRSIAPAASGSEFTSHTRNVGSDLGLDLHYLFNGESGFGLYAGGGYRVISDVVAGGTTILSSGGPLGHVGLSYTLP